MIRQLRLNSLANCKKSYCRLLRGLMNDEVDESKARAAAYLLNGILQYWRLESDLQIEEELEAIRRHVGLTR